MRRIHFKQPWIDADYIVEVAPGTYHIDSIYWDGKYWPDVTITMKEPKWQRP